MTGTVKTIQQEKGWGFITGENGIDYFFHRSACTGSTPFSQFTRKMAVTFEPEDDTRGPRAMDVDAE